MYDVVYMLITALVGFVLSYVVITIFNVGSTSDASLGRDLEQLTIQITNLLVNTVFLPLNGIWGRVMFHLVFYPEASGWLHFYCSLS